MRSMYLFSLKRLVEVSRCQGEKWANLAWDVWSGILSYWWVPLGGCFIDLPSYRPLGSLRAMRCMRAPVPAAFLLHHLAFGHCLFSTVLTDISLYLPFLEQSFLPDNFFTSWITTNCFVTPSFKFSAWQTPVYCLHTDIRGSYWCSIYTAGKVFISWEKMFRNLIKTC